MKSPYLLSFDDASSLYTGNILNKIKRDSSFLIKSFYGNAIKEIFREFDKKDYLSHPNVIKIMNDNSNDIPMTLLDMLIKNNVFPMIGVNSRQASFLTYLSIISKDVEKYKSSILIV